MSKKVVILGAGASCSYRESPTGERPPLAKEIIPTFHKLSISENRYVLVGAIINYVRDMRGINPIEFASWSEDIEAVFSEIDETVTASALELQRGNRNPSVIEKFSRSMMAYNQLVFLFSSILNEIQNGPVSIPYALLANELGSEDCIVTFNWDTLMDRALNASGKWSPSKGYCLKSESIYDDGWFNPDKFPCVNGCPQYIKLHGSTNWLVPLHGIALSSGNPYSLNDDMLDKLYVFLKATRPYQTYKDRYWGSYEPFSYCYYPPNLPGYNKASKKGYKIIRIAPASDINEAEAVEDSNIYSIPLIIPPIRNKQYGRYGKIFSELWTRAEKAISECQKLYVVGYSFPNTDLSVKEMFKRALTLADIDQIIIINPSPERARDIFVNEFGNDPSKVTIIQDRFENLMSRFDQIFNN